VIQVLKARQLVGRRRMTVALVNQTLQPRRRPEQAVVAREQMRRRVFQQSGSGRHLKLTEVAQVLLRRAHGTIRLDGPTVEH